MGEVDAMRGEIEHLRRLAALNTDARVLAEVDALIRELEHSIRQTGNGPTDAL